MNEFLEQRDKDKTKERKENTSYRKTKNYELYNFSEFFAKHEKP